MKPGRELICYWLFVGGGRVIQVEACENRIGYGGPMPEKRPTVECKLHI